MTSKLAHLTQRMLLVCALCSVPLVATATSVIADESFDSVAHSRQMLLNHASQAGWAGDKFSFGAMARAEHDDHRSFGHKTRAHTPSQLAGGEVFSYKGVLNGDSSPFNPLSESSLKNEKLAIATPVPEPSTYALMLAGLAGLGFVAMRRRRRLEGLGHEG